MLAAALATGRLIAMGEPVPTSSPHTTISFRSAASTPSTSRSLTRSIASGPLARCLDSEQLDLGQVRQFSTYCADYAITALYFNDVQSLGNDEDVAGL
jgi:hypothetical protein